MAWGAAEEKSALRHRLVDERGDALGRPRPRRGYDGVRKVGEAGKEDHAVRVLAIEKTYGRLPFRARFQGDAQQRNGIAGAIFPSLLTYARYRSRSVKERSTATTSTKLLLPTKTIEVESSAPAPG